MHITGYGWRLEPRQIEKRKRDQDQRPWKFCFISDKPVPTGISLGSVSNVGPFQGIGVGGVHVPGTRAACLDNHKYSAEIVSIHGSTVHFILICPLKKRLGK